MISLRIAVLLFCLSKAFAQFNCEDHKICSECIQQFGCSWCLQPKNSSTHCINESKITNLWCSKDKIIAPPQALLVKEDKPFSKIPGKVVQLKPQRIDLSLRQNEEFKFNFTYKQSENYPVDLYFIMDLSFSMKDYKDILSKLGQSIADTIKSLTNNFRLGFGSFVDKPTVPYVDLSSKYKDKVRPYSFINHLSLTEQYTKFNREVENAKISTNIDSPEGGFDALMQAIVCTKEIGWRKEARRIIVFATDAAFHIAGDGKLGGVVEPNDAQCRMTQNQYNESLRFDYPSVSQIKYVAQLNNINLLFAVHEKSIKHYEALTKYIKNSQLGKLEKNPGSIVKLIGDNYNAIVNSVVMTSNVPKDVLLTFSSNCRNKIENGCENIHVGEEVQITATIKPTKCSETDADNIKTISIKPHSLSEEITVALYVSCKCACDYNEHPSTIVNDIKCNTNGDFKCGVCRCHYGFYGDRCECSGDSAVSEDVSVCQMEAESEVCSGRGYCKCGGCQCNPSSEPEEIFSGKFCECSNYRCPRNRGLLCGGNGKCECGRCICDLGWEGDSCNCNTRNSTCISPETDQVCSGFGRCNCGVCQCEPGNTGKFCEICYTCPNERCDEFMPCVECVKSKSEEDCDTFCSNYTLKIVDQLEDTNGGVCNVLDEERCSTFYQYKYEDPVIYLYIKKESSCPVNIYVVLAIVAGVIILIGILSLILWKFLTSLHDKNAYVKFQKQREQEKWGRDNNPLYICPSSNFQNVAYKRKSTPLNK